MVIAFDTNIFIYYFEQNPDFGAAAKQALGKLKSTNTRGVTSIISLIELLSLPQDQGRITDLENRFSEIANLETLDVDKEVGLEAAKIRRKYGFRTSDSIQLATALFAKADRFITNDNRLKKFPELKTQLLSD